MTRRYRQRRINPFLPTEEYNKAVERRNNPTAKDKARKARYEATVHTDMRIIALYKERDRLNALEPMNLDPLEVDHIRPLCMGGQHVYENLRLLRASQNCNESYRTEERIRFLTMLVALNRKQGYIS